MWSGATRRQLSSDRADLRRAINGAFWALVLPRTSRNTVLFFPEAALVSWPAWTHDAVGLAAFTVALVPLMLFITAVARSFR
jgi:hypothetical protein